MSGEWIKLRLDLRSDPAVFKLAAITKLDRFAIVGRLAEFWGWADKHVVDGHVDGATSTVVDDVVSFSGFADALVVVGWLNVHANSIEIPRHERHNSESSKERDLKNKRQARWRAKRGDGEKPCVDSAPSTSPSTKASTREEKRRVNTKRAKALSSAAMPLTTVPAVNPASPTAQMGALVAPPQAPEDAPPPMPVCPHLKLIVLFRKCLPTLAQPKAEMWDGKPADNMRARWRWLLTATRSKDGTRYATNEDEALAWFEKFFVYVDASDFLMGRHGDFKCTLQWLVVKDNFAKVVQGNYENKEAA